MASLTAEGRAALLELLRLNAGQAVDDEKLPREMYPVSEHLRALESDVVLIVGDRGAGKTALKHSVTRSELREALARRAANLRIPSGHAEWRTGWPLEAKGPDVQRWRSFARMHGENRDDLVSAWFSYLLRTVSDLLPESAHRALQELLSTPGVDVERCLQCYRSRTLEATAALDGLDEQLLSQDRWVFIAYDELDTVVFDDWEALGIVVRGLVSLWAAYARRWRRIRPKLFLRSDFYKHHREIAGADVAKLAANRVELTWSDKNLYGALIKHIINKHPDLHEHLKKTVQAEHDPVLGWVPALSKAPDAKPFVERLVGEYMGANEKKGLAFKWLLDHLRDGNDRVVPRTLVWLIEFAAERERDDPRATGAHLLHHVSLRNALDRVSRAFRQQAETNEFRWLTGLGERLQRDREVPWSRREVEKLLAQDFNRSWSNVEDIRPPGNDGREVLENLVELGVLRARSDGMFDVPDLYLAGLNLRRKGGVARI